MSTVTTRLPPKKTNLVSSHDFILVTRDFTNVNRNFSLVNLTLFASCGCNAVIFLGLGFAS